MQSTLLDFARRHLQAKAVNGGDKRDRTVDLLHAMQALSQLSYTPNQNKTSFSASASQIFLLIRVHCFLTLCLSRCSSKT